MGNLRFAAAILFVAACGNDHAQTQVDAAVDSKMIDAKVWMDAPPPMYDLTCYGATPGTAVDATITVSGSAGEVSQSGLTPVAGITIDAYKVGSNNSAATDTSAATTGDFTLGPITSNGVAIEYVRGLDERTQPTYRTTFLYPPNPLRSSFDQLPVPLIDQSLMGQLALLGCTQDDTTNGMLFVAVNDCNIAMPTGIDGATLSVKQNNAEVGDVIDLGQFIAQAAGTFIVLNVPDGATVVSASYNGMNFPAHTVVAHKKPNGGGTQMGTITATAVPPGPIN
jgi:hypothetical protein